MNRFKAISSLYGGGSFYIKSKTMDNPLCVPIGVGDVIRVDDHFASDMGVKCVRVTLVTSKYLIKFDLSRFDKAQYVLELSCLTDENWEFLSEPVPFQAPATGVSRIKKIFKSLFSRFTSKKT